MSRASRYRAILGIALAQFRHERTRTVLAILGVAMAVLSTILLASTGVGVIDTGQEKFSQSGRDLWMTGGPTELRPGAAGGFENSMVDAHTIAAELGDRDDVAVATPLAFQTVYVGQNTSDYETVIAAGAPANDNAVSLSAGRGFQRGDIHYANGSYDGPMTHEVVVDSRTAALLNVSVNETIHVGGTLATAREHEFTIVGISSTYSRFVGAPTVTLHLSELQAVTGTTASDRATFVSIRLSEGANASAVREELQTTYPEYTVRTNEQQLRATLKGKAVVIASGVSLVALAVVAGVLLLTNLQLSYVYRHRRTLGALTALGMSRLSLLGLVLVTTLLIGLVGGLVAVGASIPATWAINRIVTAVVGFENVVAVSERFLLAGLAGAVAVSVAAGLVAGLYLFRLRPLDQLR